MWNIRQLGLIGGLVQARPSIIIKTLSTKVPEILIIHADVNRVLRSVAQADQQDLAAYFAKLIERLAAAGAEVAAIAAIQPHPHQPSC